MLSSLALLLLAAAGSVHGTVRSHPSGEPVPFATVEVAEAGRRVSADRHGYYVVRGLPAGTHRLRVSALGHRPWTGEAAVAEGGEARLDVRLESVAVSLAGVEGVAEPRRRDAPGPGSVTLDPVTLRAVPGIAEPDVFRAVQTLPSVAAASDYSSALYVRGGSPDQTLLSLDGAPLFNPFHLAGLFSAVDPDAVAAVELRPGALPADVGDRLSGTVDVLTRDGGRDHLRSSGAVSLLSARASVDGPLPERRGSWLLSARRSYVDLFAAAAHRLGWAPVEFPYSFHDAHLKLTHDVGAAGKLSASLYLNDEGFEVPEAAEIGDAKWNWGSRAASLQYRQPLGGGMLLEAMAAYSGFRGTLDPLWLPAPGETRDPIAETGMRDRLVSARLTRYGRAHRLTFGLQADDYRLSHRVRETRFHEVHEFVPVMDRTDRPRTLAAWAAGEWSPGERFRAEVGVRMLRFAGGATVWMPRAGARYDLTDRLALTFGAGRYTQAVQTLRDEESILASFFAYDLLVGVPAGDPPVADDAVLGVEWKDAATSVRVEAFAKRYRSLSLPPLAADPGRAPALVSEGWTRGSGSSRGLEVLARHASGGRSLALAYTLALGDRVVAGDTFAPHYQRTHALQLSGIQPLGRVGQLTARFAVTSGQPFTPGESAFLPMRHDPATGTWVPGERVVVYGAHNSGRLPGYRRLDVGLRRSFNRGFFGRPGTLTPYVQVLNLLGEKNVVWATPKDGGGGAVLQYAPQMPVLPTIGIEWKF